MWLPALQHPGMVVGPDQELVASVQTDTWLDSLDFSTWWTTSSRPEEFLLLNQIDFDSQINYSFVHLFRSCLLYLGIELTCSLWTWICSSGRNVKTYWDDKVSVRGISLSVCFLFYWMRGTAQNNPGFILVPRTGCPIVVSPGLQYKTSSEHLLVLSVLVSLLGSLLTLGDWVYCFLCLPQNNEVALPTLFSTSLNFRVCQ